MTKDRIKNLLDFIPLIILIGYTIVLFWTVAKTDIIFSTEHYIGIILLLITTVFFFFKHRLGVLLLGVTLLLGLFKIVAYTAAITFHSFGGSINGHSSPEIKIQSIFILWLIIHIVISNRHYVGIVKKEYWQDIFNKSLLKQNQNGNQL